MFRDYIEEILKPKTLDAVRASSAATCELLDPTSISPVPITSVREVTAEGCERLKGLLLDPRSWSFVVKRCLPHNTARFCLLGDKGHVIVAIAFNCAGWIVTGPDYRSGGFFDPVRDQIRQVLKATFPEFASPGKEALWRAGEIAKLRFDRMRGKDQH